MVMGFREHPREREVAPDPVAADVERVYRDRLPELRRVAAAVSGSRDAAADLVQEAFVRALRATGQFQHPGSLDGWVWRIVVNVALNYRRERRPALAFKGETTALARDDWGS